jgi:hypothetical protein
MKGEREIINQFNSKGQQTKRVPIAGNPFFMFALQDDERCSYAVIIVLVNNGKLSIKHALILKTFDYKL